MFLITSLGRRLFAVIFCLVIGFLGGYWFNQPNDGILLPRDVETKVIIRPGETRIITKEIVKREFIPLEGKVEVEIKKDGQVQLRTKTKGLSLRPGLGALYAPPRIYPSLDLKLAYASRWGLVVGTPLHNKEWKKPYCGVTFQLTPNTALMTGMNNRKRVVFGIRVAL